MTARAPRCRNAEAMSNSSASCAAVVHEDGCVDMTSPGAQLDTIAQMPRADQRGRALEQFVADLFRHHHFKVTLNAGVAHPRQTDVLAARVADVYLIECKWRADKANIDDLDSLR